jgi:hypothetical protein
VFVLGLDEIVQFFDQIVKRLSVCLRGDSLAQTIHLLAFFRGTAGNAIRMPDDCKPSCCVAEVTRLRLDWLVLETPRACSRKSECTNHSKLRSLVGRSMGMMTS